MYYSHPQLRSMYTCFPYPKAVFHIMCMRVLIIQRSSLKLVNELTCILSTLPTMYGCMRSFAVCSACGKQSPDFSMKFFNRGAPSRKITCLFFPVQYHAIQVSQCISNILKALSVTNGITRRMCCNSAIWR